MKINIISKNNNLISFAYQLKHIGYDVNAINTIQPGDILIYDVEFKKDIPPIDSIKIENYNNQNQKVEDGFSISFFNDNTSYTIKEHCILSGVGETKQELVSDVCISNPQKQDVEIIGKISNLNRKVKIFSYKPLKLFNFCGFVPEEKMKNVYASSKVSLCLNKFSLFRTLESGGTPLTNLKDIDLPDELIFSEQDFEKKIDYLIQNKPPNIDDIRNETIKKYNPLTQWAEIFEKINLKKSSEKTKKAINARTKDLYF